MADTDQTPQAIALRLLEIIAKAEGKRLELIGSDVPKDWILGTYAECLATVDSPYGRLDDNHRFNP